MSNGYEVGAPPGEPPRGAPFPTYELVRENGQRLAYVQERPIYCDRGRCHANIDVGGFPVSNADWWPRYYFSLQNATWEAEQYLRAKGVDLTGVCWVRKVY